MKWLKLSRLVAPSCVLLAAAPLGAAPVFFTDGLLHVLPGDPAFADDDWIILNGGSTLDLSGAARVTGEPSTAGDVAFGGDALASAAGTRVQMRGGSITGGSADGLIDASSPLAGVVAFGGYAIDSGGEFEMTLGTIRGGAAQVVIDPSVERAIAVSGAGLQIGVATALLDGGLVESGLALASGGSFENEATSEDALIVDSDAFVRVGGATIRVAEARVEQGGWTSGSALAIGGDSLRALDGSRVLIEAGTLTGGDARATAGSEAGAARAVPGRALVLFDGGHVVIRGGSFSAGVGLATAAAGEPTAIDPPAALEVEITGAARPARLLLFGGAFRGARSLRVARTDAVPADAQIEIFGGDLDSPGTLDLELAHPFVVTRVHGSGLALDGVPLASGPVSATSGTLSGTLQLGDPFAWTFERQNGAPLEVQVPEPVAGLSCALWTLGAFGRRALRRHATRRSMSRPPSAHSRRPEPHAGVEPGSL